MSWNPTFWYASSNTPAAPRLNGPGCPSSGGGNWGHHRESCVTASSLIKGSRCSRETPFPEEEESSNNEAKPTVCNPCDLRERKQGVQAPHVHLPKSFLRACVTQGSWQRTSPHNPSHSGWLLICPQQSGCRHQLTGILGTRIPCMTAHTMVRQLVSVVKESI